MPRRRPLGAPIAALVGVALAAASASLLAMGGPPVMATFDPCYGYDLCVHVYLPDYDIGEGNGTVTSNPAGINCRFVAGHPDPTTTCDHYFHANFVTQISVTLHGVADPDSGVSCATHSSFLATCDVSNAFQISASWPVKYTFRLFPLVSVGNDQVGGGIVTSSPSGISCSIFSGPCGTRWSIGTSVMLTATPAGGYAFSGWLGYCFGQGPSCVFGLSADVSTTAVFRSTAPPPTPTPSGTATPTPAPHATAGASAVPTAQPRPTPVPGGSLALQTTASLTPSPSASSTSAPSSAGATPASTDAVALAGSGAPGTGVPDTAAGNTVPVDRVTTDLTPVIVAVVGAGILIALAILGAAVMLRGRRRSEP